MKKLGQRKENVESVALVTEEVPAESKDFNLRNEEMELGIYDSDSTASAVDSDIQLADESLLAAPEIDSGDKVYQTLSHLDYTPINSKDALLFLPFQTCIYLKGHLSMKVLSGTAEVLGFTLEEDLQKVHPLFSPRGYSLLCIRSIHKKGVYNKSIFHMLKKEGLECEEGWLKSKSTNNVLIQVKPMECRIVDYLNRLFPSNILRWEPCAPPSLSQEDQHAYEEICSQLDTSIILHGATFNARFYQQPEYWQQLTQELLEQLNRREPVRLLICGGKGVGKSTLLRYTVNRLLRQVDSVLVLDFDPGQPEFTPMGFVSATVVSSALLGPNFTHLHKPVESYFVGDADITAHPNRYIHCCTQLLHTCRQQPSLMNLPTIINTMGFTAGVGLDMSLDIIRLSQPSRVVQLSSRSSRRNFPAALDRSYVVQHPRGWQTGAESEHLVADYRFDMVVSAAESSDKSTEEWGFRPSELRNIGLVSYFSQLSTGPEWSLTDATPYKISWNSVAICVSHESLPPALALAALNASLVALCILDAETVSSVPRHQLAGHPTVLGQMPAMPCLGYGLVRAVDYQKRLIYVVTPEPADRLGRVNCLVMGGVHLPEAMLLDAPSGLRKHPGGCKKPQVRVPYAVFGPSATQPLCVPFKKYNPLLNLRGFKQV